MLYGSIRRNLYAHLSIHKMRWTLVFDYLFTPISTPKWHESIWFCMKFYEFTISKNFVTMRFYGLLLMYIDLWKKANLQRYLISCIPPWGRSFCNEECPLSYPFRHCIELWKYMLYCWICPDDREVSHLWKLPYALQTDTRSCPHGSSWSPSLHAPAPAPCCSTPCACHCSIVQFRKTPGTR